MRRVWFPLWLVAVLLQAPLSAAVFLTIAPDARTIALGGAGVALDDMGAGAYYNPASIALGPRIAATWTHVDLLGPDGSLDHVAIALNRYGRFGLAAGLQYLNAFSGHMADIAPGISSAYRVLPSLSAGLTAKAVYSFVYDVHALTFAVDAGVDYQPMNALTLGLAVANLGPDMRVDTTASSLPRIARLGFAFRPAIQGPVSALATAQVSRDLFPELSGNTPWHAGAGMEIGFSHLAFARVGYRYESFEGWKGFTWGVGLEHRGIRLDVGVDGYVVWVSADRVRFQISGRV